MNKNELRNTILSQIQLPCIGKNRMHPLKSPLPRLRSLRPAKRSRTAFSNT